MTEPAQMNKHNTLNKLSDFGLLSDLFFSLNYHNVMIQKSGLIGKWNKKQVPLDIDLSCILYDEAGNHLDLIWYKNLRDESESVIHYGDQLQGYKAIDNKRKNKKTTKNHQPEDTSTPPTYDLSPTDLETIQINLAKLPRKVFHIALIVTSMPNCRLSKVPTGEVELLDIEGNTGMRVDLTRLPKDCKHLWVGSLVRVNADSFYEDGNPKNTKHFWRLLKKEQPLFAGKKTKQLSEMISKFIDECAEF